MKENGILSQIGNTPVVELRHFDTGPCRLFVKLENTNPGGSIKDRPALSMIQAGISKGKIKPDTTLVEATAGNTGISLALVSSQMNYRLKLVIPDKMSREKTFLAKALGAEVIMTRSDVMKGHPDYYQDLAKTIATHTNNAYFVDQFNNPANPLAHEKTTGPEIWEQMEGQVDAIICGVGSGGTLGGLSKFFSQINKKVEFVLADPVGSMLEPYVKTGKTIDAGSWLVEGIGEDFIPPLSNISCLSTAYSIADSESFLTARKLLRSEGIFGGSSSGTLVAAALRYCRDQPSPKKVLTLICDSGHNYLSKMYNDYWMLDLGFLEGETFGDLRDIITHRYRSGDVITVAPEDTFATALKRMKLYDISQLPVMKDKLVTGLIDESDLLLAVEKDSAAFSHKVQEYMTSNVTTVPPDADIHLVMDILDQGLVVIVSDQDQFFGLITRIDLLNYLRKRADRD